MREDRWKEREEKGRVEIGVKRKVRLEHLFEAL